MKVLKKILLYIITLLHIPFTAIKILVAVVIVLDDWSGKVIKKFLSETGKK